MTISNRTLVQIAGWGGLIVSGTGFYLQCKYIDRIRGYDYYKSALKTLRTHPGAVFYLGEPIKDKRFKITDPENNTCNDRMAKFCVPVSGSKDRGSYYFWAEKDTDDWKLIKAELELKSKPDARLVIVKSTAQVSKMFVGTSREKFFYHNTLLCLIKSLQQENVTVDLRNDSYVCGLIVTVDGYMNITFSNAVYCDPQGNEFSFEHLFIHGRNIRYVHIPENVYILDAIRKELIRTKKEPVKKTTEQSRKVKKALKQHMETVASLNT